MALWAALLVSLTVPFFVESALYVVANGLVNAY